MQAGSFDEFWPYYLTQHARPTTRILHVVGTAAATSMLAAAIVFGHSRLALWAPIVAYGLAWLGHGLIERNHPATFEHPWWSLRADYRMVWLWLTGRLAPELAKAGVPPR